MYECGVDGWLRENVFATANALYFTWVSGVTQLFKAIDAGDTSAADQLLPLVYEELRKLAATKLARELPGQTLQPTALVHEAWLRLVGSENPSFKGRGHFFAAAAEAMRRIMIDRARQKRALKRQAGVERVNLDDVDVAIAADDDTLLAVDEAIEKLAREDPDSAAFIKLRFFAGLTNAEAAGALGIPERTARRYWSFARAWLYRELQKQGR
jgi:RNA polymerase sigma factor (TIGR02999 family)